MIKKCMVHEKKGNVMYYVSKKMEISAAHRLNLDYESACRNWHGHGWLVVVYCRASKLNHNGMVVDFKTVKNEIHGTFDHNCVNDIMGDLNPTAENMAKWIFDKVNDIFKRPEEDGDGKCYKVSVQESEGNVAVYEID